MLAKIFLSNFGVGVNFYVGLLKIVSFSWFFFILKETGRTHRFSKIFIFDPPTKQVT